MRTLSIRRAILVVLVAGVVIAGAQLWINLKAFRQAAFLLSRAEISYRQLGAYQDLSVATLEYVVTPSGNGQKRIEQGLADIDRLTVLEIGLIEANGGAETNARERDRLGRMEGALRGILSVANTGMARSGDMAEIYKNTLKPLMLDAVADEQKEVRAVEQSMRALQNKIDWIEPIGLAVQTFSLCLLLLLIVRAVLGPLSRLVSDIQEFGRGSLAHRVAILRRDEFGLLGQHINRMARHLERGRKALVDANAGLEQTVAERTRELSTLNENLVEIDASRRRFFADVSHELRTPLTAIIGEADVTLRTTQAGLAPYRDALTSIRANSTYLNRRIDDLMALARSNDGKLEQEAACVDLAVVVREAIAEIASLAKIHTIAVVHVPPADPVLLRGDQRKLRQCLMILLDNAVKFSRPNQTVHLTLEVEAGQAHLGVVDHGRGIAIKELPKVFERFYQTEVGRRMGGTGLGLAIARRIVEAHAGRITLENSETGGTVATITLPLLESTSP